MLSMVTGNISLHPTGTVEGNQDRAFSKYIEYVIHAKSKPYDYCGNNFLYVH